MGAKPPATFLVISFIQVKFYTFFSRRSNCVIPESLNTILSFVLAYSTEQTFSPGGPTFCPGADVAHSLITQEIHFSIIARD